MNSDIEQLKDRACQFIDEHAQTIIDAGLPIEIDSVYPISEYEAALHKLEQAEQLGKIVITHGDVK